MKHRITVISQGKIPEEIEIEQFESQIGIRLPDSYREFLLELNPINLKECHFTIEGNIYEIHNFTPFGTGKWTLEQNYKNLKDHFENRFIAFAGDSGGWQYIFSIEQNENFGKIYFCRMDEEIEDATTFLANSFEEFINGFHINPDF